MLLMVNDGLRREVQWGGLGLDVLPHVVLGEAGDKIDVGQDVAVFVYTVLHVPSAQVFTHRLVVMTPPGRAARATFLELLNHWNAALPGIWQYFDT